MFIFPDPATPVPCVQQKINQNEQIFVCLQFIFLPNFTVLLFILVIHLDYAYILITLYCNSTYFTYIFYLQADGITPFSTYIYCF